MKRVLAMGAICYCVPSLNVMASVKKYPIRFCFFLGYYSAYSVV